jgi:methylthioribose-1-phosphate isomerase
MPVPTIEWTKDAVRIVDQTRLPLEKRFLDLRTKEEMWDAIKTLKVRGAPAIGIAAALGLYLGMRDFDGENGKAFLARFEEIASYIGSSRPTAVNLFWAIRRMRARLQEIDSGSAADMKKLLLEEALEMIREDNRVCLKIGEHGASLIEEGYSLLTHCNAGGLATAMYGTALSPMFKAHEMGLKIHVFVDETRPLLQGARITAWELVEAGIPATLITDNMAATVMKQGRVSMVIVGADRIAANGDAANKIGTLGVAVLAEKFGVPFYVAAPLSTIDLDTARGEDIPIEERSPDEVIRGFGTQTAPSAVKVYNPAFDVTPSDLISGIVTERGIIRAPYGETIRRLFEG